MGELANNAHAYREGGVRVVPILAQDARAVRRYIQDVGFPLDILIDESRDVARAYGVWHRLGIDAWNIARPALFFVGCDRTIRSMAVARRQTEFLTEEEIVRRLETL